MSFLLVLYLLSLCASKVVITEVVPHSDVEDGYYDYIELHNTGDKSVDISGHFLSDKGSEPMRCKIKQGVILPPGGHRSFSCQAPGTHVPLVADCTFRLSKVNDKIYYGRLNATGRYESVDIMNIGATINRIANQRYKPSDDRVTHLIAFPTENFDERYPIVGPFVISEIVWAPAPGKQQYVKFTCLFGQQSLNGPSLLSSRSRQNFQLRFEEHKDLYTDANALTPSAFDLPVISVQTGDSVYVTSGNPATFASENGIPSNRVFGPWKGRILNATSGEVWVGMYGREHSGLWVNELIRWKPKGKDGWRPIANGGLQRVSKHSVSVEPDNWIGIGNKLYCNLSSPYPASDCPHLDKCTANFCVNEGGRGVCKYDALVCNHPNWDLCYPDYICKLPAPPRYNAGCKLTSAVFGHTTIDTEAFGFYGTVGNEDKWYDVGCTRKQIDCDVAGWNKWSKCADCHDTQNRTRDVQTYPSQNPDGKACPNLSEKRICNYDGKCKPCDYLKCTLPKVCWPNMTSLTAGCFVPVPCELSELKETYCSVSCGGGVYYQYKNITKPAQYGGKCDVPKTVTLPCNEFPCPVDCAWNTWGAFSQCSVSCGGGFKSRSRTIKTQAANGGLPCQGSEREDVECNTQKCPIDCEGQWEEWGKCSCLIFQQDRFYTVYVEAQFGGATCPYLSGDKQTQSCETPSCVPVDCQGKWSEFTNCSCETNSQSQRYLITTKPAHGGQECPKNQTNTQTCTPVNCASNQQLAGWQIALIVVGGLIGAAVIGGVLYGGFIATASSGTEAAYQAY